jgi:hypothetical protein
MTAALLTIALFLLPGLLFFQKKDFDRLPCIIGLSLSYWISSFWVLKYIPIPLHMFVFFSLALSFILSLKGRWHVSVGTLLWFLLLAIPGIVVFSRQIAPAGADMSMHAYLAKVIYLRDGFPTTLRPLVPLDQFGKYPIGFPTIIADMMLVNGLPVYTNALLLSVFTYWFFAASLFALLRTRFPFIISALTTLLVVWTSVTPNDIIEWGANPTVLSLGFLIIALTVRRPILVLVSISTAIFLHYMLPVALLYFPLLFVAPGVLSFANGHLGLDPFALRYVWGLHQQELIEWSGIGNPIRFIQNTLGAHFFFLYLAALAILIFRRSRSIWVHGLSVAGIGILILNAQHWWLPLSPVLYPKRVVLLLLIPASVAIAEVLTSMAKRRVMLVIGAMLLALMLRERVTVSVRNFVDSGRFSTVTHDDLTAFAWLAANTTPNDVVLNTYHDAGLWIPAIAERQITTYHTNPIDMEKLGNNIGKETYVYRGAKSLAPQTTAVPIDYELVFSSGEAKVYKVPKSR